MLCPVRGRSDGLCDRLLASAPGPANDEVGSGPAPVQGISTSADGPPAVVEDPLGPDRRTGSQLMETDHGRIGQTASSNSSGTSRTHHRRPRPRKPWRSLSATVRWGRVPDGTGPAKRESKPPPTTRPLVIAVRSRSRSRHRHLLRCQHLTVSRVVR